MGLRLLLALSILPSLITAEVVYARTNRLDEAEFTQWNKTCGMTSTGKAVPYKVMVHVSQKSGERKKCVGVIINKRFVVTRATCYYDRKVNDYYDDSDMRVATNPVNTKVVVCADDGINCDLGKGLKEVGVMKVLYPQIIHYSQDYETVADIALLEIGEDFTDDRQICTPQEEEKWEGQRVFLLSEDITAQPYYEGEWEWNYERTCAEVTVCVERLTFKPDPEMATKPSNGLFIVKKNNRFYLLGTLKYLKDSPKIMKIFPYFIDFVCTNTGNCGNGYDNYMYTRETRVLVNGLPLPQVSHRDVTFVDTKYDPLFFRYLPDNEMKDVSLRCGKPLTPPAGQKKNKWHAFPYMAAVVRGSRVCSGAFISQVHVVTVAHCLFEYSTRIDEFLVLRDKEPGSYMDPSEYEVRYGSECYADGIPKAKLDECDDPEMVKSIKTSKVRSIIIEGLRQPAVYWRYKYQLVLLELEQPVSKEVVVPICIFPGTFSTRHDIPGNEGDSFHVTSAGNPEAQNSFVSATGNTIEITNCEQFRVPKHSGRIEDFNCRDDNRDMMILGKSDARNFRETSVFFLGAQLTFYNHTQGRKFLYGLAHFMPDNLKGNSPSLQSLGAFYPIWRHQDYICWFTGVCHFGRFDNSAQRHFRVYTPEYRLTVSVLNAPVQRAGKNNLSNYEDVTKKDRDLDW